MTDWLISYHREHPMIPGVPKAEWSARFLPDLDTKEVNTLLAMWEKQRMLIQRGNTSPFIPSPLICPPGGNRRWLR